MFSYNEFRQSGAGLGHHQGPVRSSGHTAVAKEVSAAIPGSAGDDAGAVAPSGLSEWWPILELLGLRLEDLNRIASRAALAGVPFQVELMASGIVREYDLFKALARYLGLAFVADIRAENLLMRQNQCLAALRLAGGVGSATAIDPSGHSVYLLAPEKLDIGSMRRYLASHPEDARHLRVAMPSVLRAAVRERGRESLSRMAIDGLFNALPSYSARFVVNAWQGAALGALTVCVAAGFAAWTQQSLLALHVLLSLAFLSCVALRIAAARRVPRRPSPPAFKDARTAEMPTYTVLVALYKEAEVVPDLLMALGRLVWPRSKLEIMLVCESDDHETLAAIRAQDLRSYIQVIEVPPEGPRTKPKALSYALPTATGEFLVLYDAEDRPHPFQLVEAWQRFRDSDDTLACVQAPLEITNRRESWLSAMFALEYSALFHGLLPWLARHRFVLPLGGTSNHFRRTLLERVGAWDPCNVTEDADLGLRLNRLGYRTDVISCPTYEDAPTTIRVWLPQRTRWCKGWAQTWLVHMRNIGQLWRELGAGSFAVTQVLFPGMLLSALLNVAFVPTIVGLAAYRTAYGALPVYYDAILALDVFNVLFGYGAFLALGWWTLPRTKRYGLCRHALLTPVYWGLLSLAAWRAIWQLYQRPHHWEKTPHRPHHAARKSHAHSPAALSAALLASRPRARAG